MKTEMKFEKKTTVIILVAIIGLSSFIGLAAATSGSDPFTQILQILLGIKAQTTNIENKVDSAAPAAINFYKDIFPEGSQYKLVNVLPLLQDAVYIGHINLGLFGTTTNRLNVRGSFTNSAHWMYLATLSFDDWGVSNLVSLDFVCQKLDFELDFASPNPTGAWAQVTGALEYTICTDVSSFP